MAVPAASHGNPDRSGDVDRDSMSLPADPLRRLEAELGDADGGRSDDERLYVEAQGLVEEAWSLVTECLVLRDGLLDACREIEQTMEGIQQRLSAMPFALETNGQVGDVNGMRSVAGGPVAVAVNGGASIDGAQIDGTPINGASINGASSNGAATV